MIAIFKRYITSKNRKKGTVTLGLIFAASIVGTNLVLSDSQPLPIPENTAIFASESITLDKEVNILSGDTISNGTITTDQNSIFQGSITGDTVNFSQNVHIFGNLEADTIVKDKDVVIDGETISPRTTADFIMPQIVPFTPGTQNITLSGANVILNPGSYNKITISPQARITVTTGIYNAKELIIGREVILNFSEPATFNISNKFTIDKQVIFNLNSSLDINDIQFNYIGTQLVSIGQRVFLAGKLLAPNAQVFIGQQNIWRGRILARIISVGKEGAISREIFFMKQHDTSKIVDDPEGGQIIVNEIIVNFEAGIPMESLIKVMDITGGHITGFLDFTDEYQIQIKSTTIGELNTAISILKSYGISGITAISKNRILLF